METSNNLELREYKPAKSGVDKPLPENSSNPKTSELNVQRWVSVDKANYVVEPYRKVSVFDVAAYIVNSLGAVTTMKLHKLVYYCQAWSLVWDDAPLFSDEIEAWANGPVVRTLFAYHKGSYTISNVAIGNKDVFSAKQKETIDSVLEFYGPKSTQWLIELTHLEDPWKNARKGLANNDRGNEVITLDSMARYYGSL